MVDFHPWLRRFFNEPLVHFLVLGLVLFAVYGLFGGGAQPDTGRIVVTQTDVDRLRTLWMQQWRRLPTREELSGLVDDFVREEILYREALAMNLDVGDPMVRRRMVQKIELLTEDLAGLSTIPEPELAAFFNENREDYRHDARLSFVHIYLNEDERGASAGEEARRLLTRLNATPVSDWEELGDRFLLQRSYRDRRLSEIGQLFGGGFEQSLLTAELDRWSGPWRSGYGLHLVRIDDRVDSRLPELVEVRARVEQDFRQDARRRAAETLYRRLKEGYEIVIEAQLAEPAGAAGSRSP